MGEAIDSKLLAGFVVALIGGFISWFASPNTDQKLYQAILQCRIHVASRLAIYLDSVTQAITSHYQSEIERLTERAVANLAKLSFGPRGADASGSDLVDQYGSSELEEWKLQRFIQTSGFVDKTDMANLYSAVVEDTGVIRRLHRLCKISKALRWAFGLLVIIALLLLVLKLVGGPNLESYVGVPLLVTAFLLIICVVIYALRSRDILNEVQSSYAAS